MIEINLPATRHGGKATSPNLVKQMTAPLAQAEALVTKLTEDLREPLARIPQTWAAGDDLADIDLDLSRIRTAAAELRPLVAGDTIPRAVRAAIVLMLEAMPNAVKFDAGIYVDAAVAIIIAESNAERRETGGAGGFTPEVLAAAVQRVWREKTFTPSIAEFLQILGDERARLQAPLALEARLIDRVARIERYKAKHTAERAEFEALREKARAAGDNRFDDDELWIDDLDLLRRRYGSATK